MIRNRSARGPDRTIWSHRWVFAVALAAFAPAVAHAQGGQKTKAPPVHRQVVSIDVRAQVPVPQIVTVRPRAIPRFRADILDTVFVDQHRWAALRVPYQAVPMVAFPASFFRSSLSSPPTDSLKER